MVSWVKNVLTSAFFVTWISDDVLVTSRVVIMSEVRFFSLESFLFLISNYCASLKSIWLVFVKIWQFRFVTDFAPFLPPIQQNWWHNIQPPFSPKCRLSVRLSVLNGILGLAAKYTSTIKRRTKDPSMNSVSLPLQYCEGTESDMNHWC